MARRAKSQLQKTGLYHAREVRGMSRTELVKRSGVSKQQLSRLKNRLMGLRLDHLINTSWTTNPVHPGKFSA